MKQLLSIAALFLLPALAWANFGEFSSNSWGSHMGMGFFGGGGGFMMIFFYVVIAFLIITFIKDLVFRKTGNADSAVQILKERFAKGEITHTEYQEMKRQVKH